MDDSPAVKAYRDRFHLNLNAGRRYDVDVTVTDLKLWEYVLDHWGFWKEGKWHRHNPLSIGKLLSEYERLEEAITRRPASNEESIRPEHLSRDG